MFQEDEPVAETASTLFTSWFDDEKFADLTLVACDKQLRAHKTVLASRSPVLASMIEQNMQNNQLVMEDVDSDVLAEMLQYMYTGKVVKISEFARKLLPLADKVSLVQPRLYYLTRLTKVILFNS